MTKNKSDTGSLRLHWYRRDVFELFPILQLLPDANRGWVEKMMDAINLQNQDAKKEFCGWENTAEDMAYLLGYSVETVENYLKDRRTREAMPLILEYMKDSFQDGVDHLKASSLGGKNSTHKDEKDNLDDFNTDPEKPAPTAPAPAPKPKPAEKKEGEWSDDKWSQIYLDAREEIKAVWPKTTPGVVNDVRIWVGHFTNTKPQDVKKEQREEWIPWITKAVRIDANTEKFTNFKDWMLGGGAAVVKQLAEPVPELTREERYAAAEERTRLALAKCPPRRIKHRDPAVQQDADEYESERGREQMEAELF